MMQGFFILLPAFNRVTIRLWACVFIDFLSVPKDIKTLILYWKYPYSRYSIAPKNATI